VFQRFTESGRQAIVLAQDEARALKHNYIGTEHILLGLLREREDLAAGVLASLGITLEGVRAQVARIVGEGGEVTAGQIPFTPRAKKVLELALREGLALGDNHIGTEHILLGIVRENEGVAARIMRDDGVDADRIRERVLEVLRAEGRHESVMPAEPSSRFRRRRRRSPEQALFEHLGRARDAALELGSYDLARELLELEVRTREELKQKPDDPET
jgi:ATP-dependent Clp protease ATP-binding subunit ClpA